MSPLRVLFSLSLTFVVFVLSSCRGGPRDSSARDNSWNKIATCSAIISTVNPIDLLEFKRAIPCVPFTLFAKRDSRDAPALRRETRAIEFRIKGFDGVALGRTIASVLFFFPIDKKLHDFANDRQAPVSQPRTIHECGRRSCSDLSLRFLA